MLYEYYCSKCERFLTLKRVVADRDVSVYCTCSIDQEKKNNLENPHSLMKRITVQKFSTSGLDHNVG